MSLRKLTWSVFSLGAEYFAPRRFPLGASETVWQYGGPIDVMLSKAKHLGSFTTFRTSLRRRHGMTLRHILSAVRYLDSLSPHKKRGAKFRNSKFEIRNFLTPRPSTVSGQALCGESHGSPKIFSLWVGAILTLLSAAPAPAQVRQEQAKLTNVVGQVEVLRRGAATWQPAKAGMPLSAGDEIRAAQNSGAEIAMVDGSIIMVFAQSRLQVRQLTSEAQTRTSMLHLVVGLVRYVVSQAGVTLVGTRQNQFTISTPTAVMAARGTDGILGYSAAAAVAATPALKPGVPPAGAAGSGGQTTLLCLGGVSALVVLPTVPGTTGTGEQIFCENGQIWNVDAGRLTLLMVLPNAVRAALEAGATPQAMQQIIQSMTPVQVIWTPLEQAIFDAAPFDLQGPTQAQVTQLATAALNTNLPATTIATAAQITPTVQVYNFEQFVAGNITNASDVQKQQAVTEASPFMPPTQ